MSHALLSYSWPVPNLLLNDIKGWRHNNIHSQERGLNWVRNRGAHGSEDVPLPYFALFNIHGELNSSFGCPSVKAVKIKTHHGIVSIIQGLRTRRGGGLQGELCTLSIRPQIHSAELELKLRLKSYVRVSELPAVRPWLSDWCVWIDEVKEALVLSEAAALWVQLAGVGLQCKSTGQQRNHIVRFQIELWEKDLQGFGFFLHLSLFLKCPPHVHWPRARCGTTLLISPLVHPICQVGPL